MNELGINTTGWIRCPSPGCGWLLDPEVAVCPEHPDVAVMEVPSALPSKSVGEQRRTRKGERR